MRNTDADRVALLCTLHLARKHDVKLQKTNLQKVIFRTERRVALGTPSYHFYRWDHGPFSKEIYEDIDSLECSGLVRNGLLKSRGRELAAFLTERLQAEDGWRAVLASLDAGITKLGPVTASAASRWAHALKVRIPGRPEEVKIHDLKHGTEILTPRDEPTWAALPLPREIFEVYHCAVNTSDDEVRQMRMLSPITFDDIDRLLA